MKTEVQEFLDRCAADGHEACKSGAEYALHFDTMAEVWDECERVDWLIWIAARLGGYDRELRLFACDCADRALSKCKNPDPRSVEAVRVARLFADGLVSKEGLEAAAWAAVKHMNSAIGGGVGGGCGGGVGGGCGGEGGGCGGCGECFGEG